MKEISSHWSPWKDARESIHFSGKGALPLPRLPIPVGTRGATEAMGESPSLERDLSGAIKDRQT